MTDNKIELAKKRAHTWHDGVVYGGGMVMTEQLLGTADKIAQYYEGADKDDVLLAAYLYKAQETKRLNDATNKNPKAARNAIGAIAMDFSPRIAHIVMELSTEPTGDALEDLKTNVKKMDDRLTDKEAEWLSLSLWAKELSPQAQAVLLAEKLQNFEVSRDKPNEKKPPVWHIEYYKTRMVMVEVIKDASPALANACVRVAEEGIKKQQTKLALLDKVRDAANQM